MDDKPTRDEVVTGLKTAIIFLFILCIIIWLAYDPDEQETLKNYPSSKININKGDNYGR